MPPQTLNEKLYLLDFDADSSASSFSSLLFTDRDYRNNPNVSFDEILILNRAKGLEASAVYFRRIEGRSSIPQLLVFDNSDGILSVEKLTDIHRKLWSSGIVPLYYVFDNTEVRIFNCRKPLQQKGKNLKAEPLDTLRLISKVHVKHKKQSEYSAKLFENGSFWESQKNRKHFKADSSSYNKLISELRRIRNAFVEGQNETICNKLLVLSIFIKYLEEREDSNGKHVLDQRHFEKYDGATCFCDVLRKNKCVEFLENLGRDVNGKIFKLTSQEKKEIEKISQPALAEFLDAKRDKEQLVFWKLYDFNYLPVELISRIYEEFIPNRKDITYTPTHLASFMVDKCMPVGAPQDNFKLIDVSCGSGIFLVTAFKRMAQWWQYDQYKKDGQIKNPKIRKLKSILKNSIYGVDLEGEATRLTIFSLTVALCEMLDPTIMWDELTKEKLVDLSDNIIAQDFFDFLETGKKFNLVIGNPPFNSPKKNKEEKEKYWNRKVKYDWEIPDKNIALAFLQQAMKLLKKDGQLSLVIPSGPLLYNNTLEYRKQFLSKYNVPQIFDFSSLTGVLFEGRNYPVVVIFAQNGSPDDKDILHVTVRRTVSAKEKLYFEIDKYDLYYVPKELATTEQLIWKANVLGSGHLYHLLKRMQGLRKLESYLKDKKKNKGWKFGEGYIIANGTKKASYLTQKRMIPTDKFNSDVINEDDIEIETANSFYRIAKRNKDIFKKPHILIKERPSLPVVFRDDDLIFKNEIVGIHAPEEDKPELLRLTEDIKANRKLYRMLSLSKSGRAAISRSIGSILKDDIMALPYPENKENLKLSRAEQIVCDDVLDYGIEQLSQGEKAKVNIKEAKRNDITAFAKVFCTSLNSIYEEGSKRFYPLEHIESLSFICQPFAYGSLDRPKKISESTKEQIEAGNLNILINNPQGKNVLYKRIVKLYPQKDMVYLIKPKILRYWLKSIALRDANEVFNDLISSGY